MGEKGLVKSLASQNLSETNTSFLTPSREGSYGHFSPDTCSLDQVWYESFCPFHVVRVIVA